MILDQFEAESSTLAEDYSQYWRPQFKEDSVQSLMPLFLCPETSFDESYPSTSSSELAPAEDILDYFSRSKAKIVKPSKVRDYFRRYPEIAELSRDVSKLVHRRFDFRAQLSLEIQNDDVPDSEYLTIYIRVPEYDNSVMDRIREIRECYYDSLNNLTGWFLLTTDFSRPR